MVVLIFIFPPAIMKVPISPHSHQSLLLSVILPIAILVAVKRLLHCVLNVYFPITNDVEPVLMCLPVVLAS